MIFELPIRPHPKQRPRIVNGHAYTPQETQEYERAIRQMVLLRMNIEGQKPYQTWCHLKITFCYASLKKPKPFCNSRPDIDNLLKAIFDALNGVCYRDDAIILRVEATKEYGKYDAILIEMEGE